MNYQKTTNEAAGGQSELTARIEYPTKEQLIWALCEVLDDTWSWRELQADTGLPQGQCEQLLAIRDAAKQRWIDCGFKIPNAVLTGDGPLWEKDVGADLAEKALKDISLVMLDQGLAWSWHCNIAMVAQDAGAPHKESNERAADFMRRTFGVDTTKKPVMPVPDGCDGE